MQRHDEKLQRVALNKLNREVYSLTFVPHRMPAQENNMSKKREYLNHKKYKPRLRECGDMVLNNMHIEEHCPTVAEMMDIPIVKFITIFENSCGYSDTSE